MGEKSVSAHLLAPLSGITKQYRMAAQGSEFEAFADRVDLCEDIGLSSVHDARGRSGGSGGGGEA